MPKFHCTHCGQRIDAPEHMAGKLSKCPNCREAVVVPGEPADEGIRRISNVVNVVGKYKKVRFKALGSGYGMYRGKGRVTVSESGIEITGSHVMSLGSRWCIGLLIMFGSAILTGGALILGLIPIFLLVEYAILTKQNVHVTWADLNGFIVNDKKKIVGLAFDGPDWTSPAYMHSVDYQMLAGELRNWAPAKEKHGK